MGASSAVACRVLERIVCDEARRVFYTAGSNLVMGKFRGLESRESYPSVLLYRVWPRTSLRGQLLSFHYGLQICAGKVFARFERGIVLMHTYAICLNGIMSRVFQRQGQKGGHKKLVNIRMILRNIFIAVERHVLL